MEGNTCHKKLSEIICKNDDPEPDCLPACKHLFGGGSGATCVPQIDGTTICICVYKCWININYIQAIDNIEKGHKRF